MLIAGAGGAAHLPGMAAAKTALPVLGVPVESKTLKGVDSLLSIVQMPAGVPVGTLAIGRAGAVNAALLAAAILARATPASRERLAAYRAAQTQSVLDAPDPASRRAASTAVTLVACIGGGQLGRMLGLAGLPLGLRFRFLDPSPDAPAREVESSSSAPSTTPAPSGASPRAPRSSPTSSRTCPSRPRAPSRRSRRRALELRPGPARREGALPPSRDPDGAVRLARARRGCRLS